jgi:hypothetical protein
MAARHRDGQRIVGFWHLASFVALHHFGRFRRIADIVRDGREMARSRMTHQRHSYSKISVVDEVASELDIFGSSIIFES